MELVSNVPLRNFPPLFLILFAFKAPNFELPIVFMTCRAKSYVNGQADAEGGRVLNANQSHKSTA